MSPTKLEVLEAIARESGLAVIVTATDRSAKVGLADDSFVACSPGGIEDAVTMFIASMIESSALTRRSELSA